MKRFATIIAAPALAALIGVGGLASAQGVGGGGSIERGAWELRYRSGTAAPKRVCVRTGRELLRLRHRGLNCTDQTVERDGPVTTVQYSCPGNGYGRTVMRRENRELVQLSGTGIAGRAPFRFDAEARLVGRCDSR